MHARSEVCVDHPHVVEAGQAPAMEVAIADCFHHEKACWTRREMRSTHQPLHLSFPYAEKKELKKKRKKSVERSHL